MSSSESEYDENPADQQSENGDQDDAVTNGQNDDNDKVVTWNDLVRRVHTFRKSCYFVDYSRLLTILIIKGFGGAANRSRK